MEIISQLHALAGFIAESEIQRYLLIQSLVDADVANTGGKPI